MKKIFRDVTSGRMKVADLLDKYEDTATNLRKTVDTINKLDDSIIRRRVDDQMITELSKYCWKSVGRPDVGILAYLKTYLPNLLKALEASQKLLNESNNDVITKHTMTYLQLTLARNLDVGQFVTTFSNDIIIHILGHITANNRSLQPAKLLPAPRLHKMKEDSGAFIRAMVNLAKPDIDYYRKLSEIPHAIIDPDTMDSDIAIMGKEKLDPVNIVSDGFILQTVLPVRKWFADREEKKRQLLIEKSKTLELLLLDLEDSKNGENDANVQRSIDYHRGRLAVLHRDIDRMDD